MKLFAITATLAASKSTRNETNRPQPQVRKFLGQGSRLELQARIEQLRTTMANFYFSRRQNQNFSKNRLILTP